MKSFRTLVAAAFLALGTTAMAQATYVAPDGTQYQFVKHAFLDLQGGAQYTLGESEFGNLISPNVQLGLGYQFSPVLGARFAVNGWQSKGGFDFNGENDTYKFKYIAPGVDVMFNLSNLFCGWNPNRVFNVTAFLGAGVNFAFDNDEVKEKRMSGNKVYEFKHYWEKGSPSIVGRGGVDLNFRLSDAVSLMLEGNANVLNDHYNSKHADNPDWYFNALVGLRINLGKSYTKILPPTTPNPNPNPEPDIDVTPTPTPGPTPPPQPEVIEPIRRDIFFTINSTVISDQEAVKIRQIADYMKKYPNAKVDVRGYADKGTGNATINARLAAGRADVVVKVLREQYNIPASRITYSSYGDTVQPFVENDLNRVSICVANPQ
ncbi:MAG: OmpA family protein [Prevotella sp.]|nr:OmpA family protein [Prevotella sp.]